MAMQAATTAWSTVTLSQKEMWQAIVPCRTSADSSASVSMDGDNGSYLQPGEAVVYESGDTVVFRALQKSDVAISREPAA